MSFPSVFPVWASLGSSCSQGTPQCVKNKKLLSLHLFSVEILCWSWNGKKGRRCWANERDSILLLNSNRAWVCSFMYSSVAMLPWSMFPGAEKKSYSKRQWINQKDVQHCIRVLKYIQLQKWERPYTDKKPRGLHCFALCIKMEHSLCPKISCNTCRSASSALEGNRL